MYIPSMSGLSLRLAIMTGLAAALANAQSSAPQTPVPSSAPVLADALRAVEGSTPLPAPDTSAVAVPTTLPDSAVAIVPASLPDTAHPVTAALAPDSSAPPSAALPSPVLPTAVATAPDSLLIGRTRHLKSDPQASVLYRSPRKAFFYSLMLPGAGQAYVGHWARASAFIVTEAAIGIGWWYYAVHKSDQALQKSKDFADAHWQQARYESRYKSIYENGSTLGDSLRKEVLSTAAPSRSTYCGSLYGSSKDNVYYVACAENLPDLKVNPNYSLHESKSLEDASMAASQVSGRRSGFADPERFYNLIGSDNEFVIGWEDASTPTLDNIKTSYYDSLADGNPDTKPVASPWGTSAMQATYNSFRSQSNDYARMQKWFLGGLILNHLVSALDAALLAQGANRKLYDMESRWWDRVRLQGGLAWNGSPSTQAQAWLEF